MSTIPAGARDFDFFHGEWRVAHRRLRRRLARDTTWSRQVSHHHQSRRDLAGRVIEELVDQSGSGRDAADDEPS